MFSNIYAGYNVLVLKPTSVEEAMQQHKWIIAMKEELQMVKKKKNQTWNLVERPQNRKVIEVKWVFRTKLNVDGLVNK